MLNNVRVVIRAALQSMNSQTKKEAVDVSRQRVYSLYMLELTCI
jgi:ribonuclease I